MARRILPVQERQSAIDLISVLLQDRIERSNTKNASQSHERHYKRLISALLWKHSEAWGKYDGCPCWSEKAIEARKLFGRVQTRIAIAHEKALRHEHVFPRKQLIEKLLKIENPTVERVSQIVNELNIGVVVTVEEHDSLPTNGMESDLWARYDKAGIKVVNTHQEIDDGVGKLQSCDELSVIKKHSYSGTKDGDLKPTNTGPYQYSIKGNLIRQYAKGRMMLDIIGYLLAAGINPDDIRDAIPWLRNRLIRVYEGELDSSDVCKLIRQDDVDNNNWVRRYFVKDNELIHISGKTFVISNQWGKRTLLALENLMQRFPDQPIQLHDS